MKKENRILILLIIFAFFLLFPVYDVAAGQQRETITVTLGKTTYLTGPTPMTLIRSTDEKKDGKIIEVSRLAPAVFEVRGKSLGVVTLTFGIKGNKYAIYDIEVEPDITALKYKLHKIFPDDKDIKVSKAGDNIVLSGTVSNAVNLSHVLAIAGSYASGGKKGDSKLINLLEVGGVQQVMLEVRISEISKALGEKMGVNFAAIGRAGRDGALSFVSALGDPAAAAILSGALISRDVTWTSAIDALKASGLIKVLAEPTLITMSGKKANFLAGGEFPYVTVEDNDTEVQFKSYGVSLNFTPTVLGNGKISMDVTPEVSDLDFTNAVYVDGYFVPGLNVRRVSTTVELADGQSFAVAGLLKDDVREAVKKVPLLGDIPILGVLFRSSEFQKNETELVIIVTPHLVKPIDMAKQTLPTDQFVEPNDLEFFLLGLEEGLGSGRTKTNARSQTSVSGGGGLDGEFGHIIP